MESFLGPKKKGFSYGSLAHANQVLASLKDSLNFERAILKLEEPSSQQRKRERTERNRVGNKQPIELKIIIEGLTNQKKKKRFG